MEHVIVKRLKDGREITIPKDSLEDTLRQGFEYVKDYNFFREVEAVDEGDNVYECPLCDFKGKTEAGLKRHKTVSHK